MEEAPDFFEGGVDHYENIGEVDYTDEYAPAVVAMDSPEDDEDVDFAGGETMMATNLMSENVMILGAPTEEPVPFETNVVPVSSEPPQESPMAKWNREFQEVLKDREEENAAKASHLEQARKDLEEFQAQREKKKEARMAKNRSDEQQKLEDMEADLENDNSWQRVVKMVELQQDSVDGMRDSKRMIDVLIKMKNDPERAVALS
jgi:hypothetical protein